MDKKNKSLKGSVTCPSNKRTGTRFYEGFVILKAPTEEGVLSTKSGMLHRRQMSREKSMNCGWDYKPKGAVKHGAFKAEL